MGVASRDKLEPTVAAATSTSICQLNDIFSTACTGNYTKTHQRQGSERVNHDHAGVKVLSEGSCSAAPDSAQTLPPPVPGLAGDTDVLGHAIRLHQAGDSEAAKDTYSALLEATPRHADALRLLGLTWYGDAIRIESSGDGSVASAIDIAGYFEQAQQFVWRAVLCAKAGREVYLILGDLGEVLRGSGALQDAERVLRSALQSNSLPTHARRQATFNLAVTLIQLRGETRKPAKATERPHDRRRYDDEVEELLRGVVADGAGTVDSLTRRATMQLGLFARTRSDSAAAVYWMEKAVRSLQFVFNVSLNPGCPSTAQELGRALLESGRANEATEVLKQALALDPATPGPLMNAALQRSESGNLVQARELYSRAYDLTGDGGVLIRMALMMSPVAASTERLLEERASVLQEVLRLTDLQRRGMLSVASPGKELERAPFLVVYAGNNQRKTMEAIARRPNRSL
ncbi:Tetratricopeptide TPR_2 repeat protein [Ectocarpus siliculosus]|uniref:Tetratricopeptide TPR_2 repeat protein n=1 Tax=Ectocarpus siliculosus TaxID=2880 RepID=D7FK40_ECTSI|nr:Tetratricopeptide TPR_2 repeat protein [Ectocarpus siliculosus]|eukprot:CBJ29250.1 Tetratricopeptide TPR_2 repeat protein [Ectocarpus siliculosus]